MFLKKRTISKQKIQNFRKRTHIARFTCILIILHRFTLIISKIPSLVLLLRSWRISRRSWLCNVWLFQCDLGNPLPRIVETSIQWTRLRVGYSWPKSRAFGRTQTSFYGKKISDSLFGNFKNHLQLFSVLTHNYCFKSAFTHFISTFWPLYFLFERRAIP